MVLGESCCFYFLKFLPNPIANLFSYHPIETQTRLTFNLCGLRTVMADDTSSLCDLIEDLGFLPSEHQFLLQLFSSSDPFAGLPGADLEPNHSEVESLQRISIDLAHEIPSVGLRQEVFSLVERLSLANLQLSQRTRQPVSSIIYTTSYPCYYPRSRRQKLGSLRRRVDISYSR